MRKAKLILYSTAAASIFSGVCAFTVSRVPASLYQVDSTNPIITLRLCTRVTNVMYTTIPIVNGQPAIVTLPYYTTAVKQPVCPVATLFSAL